MSINFISAGPYGSQASMVSSQVVTAPTGPFLANDFILAIIETYTAGGTITPPDGTWTSIGPGNVNKAGQNLFYKLSNGTEPGSYTFSSSVSNFMAGAVIQYRGAIFESISTVAQSPTGTSLSLTSAAVTPIRNGDILLLTWTANAGVINPPITLDSRLNTIINYNSSLEGFGLAIGAIGAPTIGVVSAQYTSSVAALASASMPTVTSLLLSDTGPFVTVFNNTVEGY